MLIVTLVVCAILYILYQAAGYLALLILTCTKGNALITAVAKKSLMEHVLSGVQRSGMDPGRLSANHVFEMLFGIPPNVDAWVMTIEPYIRRG